MSKSMRGLKMIWQRFRQKPFQFPLDIREQILFKLTRFFLSIYCPPGVKLGSNVRIQKLRCLSNDSLSGSIELGDHSILYENARLVTLGKGKISIGPYSVIGDARIYSRCKVKIGSHFLSSWNVFIQDYDSHPTQPMLREKQMEQMCLPRLESKSHEVFDFHECEIQIGNNVWVGSNVTILKGAQIGNHCVIATGAVVKKGVYPDYSIIAGNPAKTVKSISS